ncbi:MAG TPA: aldehyde dehydrogenase family protein [Ideonella sp.]|nr:aldehyde dehydrogenase family protein [Ideonella sp.]
MLPRLDSFIDGRAAPPTGGRYSDKFDPRTATKMQEVARSQPQDLDRAVAGASKALIAWRQLRPTDRGRILVDVGRALRAHGGSLGEIESLETGKPGQEMPTLIDLTAQFFEYYGGIVNLGDGERIDLGPSYHSYTRREPFGVVGVILPWNAPLHQAARAIAPALAAGNTVVAKPSEHTSGSLVELARLAVEAGLPEGVFNVIVGQGSVIGPAMVANPAVMKISFTGSLRAGREIGHLAAGRVLPLTLELGGKSPNIVFADADLDAAAPGSVRAFTWNSGQWCCAGTRCLVQKSVHDVFVEKLVASVKALKIGPEHDASAGPITTRAQYEKIQTYFELARQTGLKPAIGGHLPTDPRLQKGWFIEPTIYTGVSNEMQIAQEEIFGPVLCVIPFEDEADAIRIANDTEYGLGAGIWTRDVSRVHRVAAQLDAGRIVVNEYNGGFVQNPCGGFKNSGYGREQGQDAIAHYTQLKSVIVKL